MPAELRLAFVVGCLLGCLSSAAAELVVGPEMPFAEIRSAARVAQSSSGERLMVVLRDGTYRLDKTVCFNAADSGVTYRAEHSGMAILTGAASLAWRKPTADEWNDKPLSLVPDAARAALLVATIPGAEPLPGFFQGGCLGEEFDKFIEYPVVVFQNGERLTQARAPDSGRYQEMHFRGSYTTNEAMGMVTYPLGVFDVGGPARERVAAWAEEPDVWAWGLWCYKWSDARFAITNIVPSTGTIALDHRHWRFPFQNDKEYFVFNAFSEITEPGEWALDRTKRLLAVWPTTEVELPVVAQAPTLLQLEGVKDLTFSGIVFECARATAVVGRDVEGVAFEKSLVRRTGGWGIRLDQAKNCRVQGCDMYDLGEGGVWFKGGEQKTLTPGGNVADNNHIHHYGRAIPNYRPGVSLNGVGNVATHNLIHHSDHQGVSYHGCDHRIAFNIIHDACMHNDDAGALYCCQRDWSLVGTVIEHNLIHETGDHPYPVNCSSTYFDDWSSGQILRHNILSRGSRGVAMGGGLFTQVTSNLIVRMKDTPIGFASRGTNSFARAVSLKGRNSSMYRKMTADRPMFESAPWRAKHPEMLRWFDVEDPCIAHDALFTVVKGNLAVCCGEYQMRYYEEVKAWNTWEDNAELQRNPGFADYTRLDFSPVPGSKYETLIAATRFGEMGLYADAKRFSRAVKYGEGVTYPKSLSRILDPAKVRIDIHGELPAGVAEIATNCCGCVVPKWSKGRRVSTGQFCGKAEDEWTSYSFSFTPNVSGRLTFTFMGLHGYLTDYSGISATGGTYEGPANVTASHDVVFDAWLTVEKGRQVTVSFKARRHPDGTLPYSTHDANAAWNQGRRVAEVQMRDGIGRTMEKLMSGKDVTVAYIGGSITCGDTSWRVKTTEWLRRAYPQSKITEVSAAIGGTDSSLGVFRYEDDVLSKDPDLVLVEFSCNDMGLKNPVIRRSIEGMVRKTWQYDPNIDICFAYVICSYMTNEYCRAVYPRAASVHEEIAEHYGIPSVCFGARVAALCRRDAIVMRSMSLPAGVRKESEKMVFPTEGDYEGQAGPTGGKPVFSVDGVHPTPDGQQFYANCMRDAFREFAKKAAVPHAPRLGAPMFDGGFERAKWFVAPEGILKGADWRSFEVPVAEAKKPVWSWMPEGKMTMFRTGSPGDSVRFRFCGTKCRIYALYGPDCAKLEISVDGVRGKDASLFDMYCSRYRFLPVSVFEGADGVHDVEIRVSSEEPDRLKLGAPRITPDMLADPMYHGTTFVISRLMLIGDLID